MEPLDRGRRRRSIRSAHKIALAGAGVAALAGVVLIRTRNDLAAQQEAIRASWERVEAAVDRRAVVAPAFGDAVRSGAGGADSAFESLRKAGIALRAARSPGAKIQANSLLDAALGRLLILAEMTPALKGRAEYSRLFDELAAAEGTIASERRTYNELVQKYNITLSLFPGNAVARVFGFERDEIYFTTAPAGGAPH